MMKTLSDILYKAGAVEVSGDLSSGVVRVDTDSQHVKPGSLFIAVKGTRVDGHSYIPDAIRNGASAIVCEIIPEERVQGVTYIRVSDSKKALGFMASNFYGNPSSRLSLTGVTGTNGKTTTVTLLYRLFRELGMKCGMISTIRNSINGVDYPSSHTTPDARELNGLLKKMADEGCSHCFMEVSSHAIDQERIAGVQFKGGVFTNLTHDHLDYHKTFNEYRLAKKKFFDCLEPDSFALLNKDDRNHAVMGQNTRSLKKYYALKNIADFHCRIIEKDFTGMQLSFDGIEFYTSLTGKFNAYNLAAAYATAVMLSQDRIPVLTALSKMPPPDGRFQKVPNKRGIHAFVDYAHTPDALAQILGEIKEMKSGSQKLITVAGCGGDRDSEKRPKMGDIASEVSDRVVFTSDNPRSEDPEQILRQVVSGVKVVHKKKITAVTDRREAIRAACLIANNDDIILIAGKGHEKYQEIKGKKYPFDDVEVLKEILNG